MFNIGTLYAYSTSSNYGRYSCQFYYDSVTRSGTTVTLNNARVVMSRYSGGYTTNRIAGCFWIGDANNYTSYNYTLNDSGTASPATITYSIGSPSYNTSSSSLSFGVYLASTGSSYNWGNFQGNSPISLVTSVSAPVAYTSTGNWYVNTRTSTSITMYWSTSDTCSNIRYGTSTSSYNTLTVNASSGTVTISNLSPNTSYNLYFMPCNSSSGAWGNGSEGSWVSTSSATYPTSVSVLNGSVTNIQPFSCTLSMSSSNSSTTNGTEFSIYDSTGTNVIKGPYQYLDSSLIWIQNITDLTPETTYTAKFRVRTSVSNIWSSYYTQSFTTQADQAKVWIYNGTSYQKGKLWLYSNSMWNIAKKVYVYNGTTWNQGIN